MKTFEVPATDGFVNVRAFFPNLVGQVRIDQPILEFLNSENGRFALRKPFVCNIGIGSKETLFTELLSEVTPLTVSQVCSILAYLGGEWWGLLKIPPSQEELNFLIGWIPIGGELRVLYVEHEHEAGKGEEVHLHIAKPDKKEEGPVFVLYPVL